MYKALTVLTRHCNLVLASGSPRRKYLLEQLGIKFRQIVPQVPETAQPNEAPYDFAERLAREKATWGVGESNRGEIVLAGDTVVVLGKQILGKPSTEEEAFAILSQLAAQQHVVCTALALADRSGLLAYGSEKTTVVFNDISAERIWEYIRTKEPMDKAGAYGIQGMGAFLVDRIVGNLDNVVGLPRTLLNHLAGEILPRLGHATDCE